ncbi:hypothetical protein B9G55_14205 [Saccharibacillus sp. O16]|nr:hypothetical protein B9G55_14205 [Saccharibacillus sp. O16]
MVSGLASWQRTADPDERGGNKMTQTITGRISRTIGSISIAGLLLTPISYGATGYGAAQAAPAKVVAGAEAGKYPAVIGTAKLYAAAPLLRDKPSANEDWRELSARSSLPAGSELKLFAQAGDWLRAKDQTGASGWIPAWYASEAAAKAKTVRAVKLTPAQGAKLYLTPGSQAAWAYTGEPLVSMRQIDGWYAVSPVTGDGNGEGAAGAHPAETDKAGTAAPDEGRADNASPSPFILWIKASDAQNIQPVNGGLLKPDSGYSTTEIREILDGLLRPGVSKQAVLELLGEPFSIMDGRMTFPNEPDAHGFYHWTSGGVEWRYERPDAHLIIRLSDAGQLIGANWILPLTRYEQQDYHSWLQTPDFAAVYQPLPLLRSIQPEVKWRTRIDTDYAYLEGAVGDTLIVRGDDGGLSGMHYSSILYGLDRSTGRIEWSFDAGWSAMSIMPDSTGQGMIVSGYLPEGANPNDEGLIAHMNLETGQPSWTYPLNPNAQTSSSVVGDSVIVLSAASEPDSMGTLVALDERTGKTRWKQQIRGLRSSDLLNGKGSNDPYVLLGQEKTLRALDPSNGRTVWTVSSENGLVDGGQSFASPPAAPPVFAKPDGTRWIKFNNEGWRKINLLDGQTIARYAHDADERLQDLGGGYLLVQSHTGKGGLYNSEAYQLHTRLIDTTTDQEVWARTGLIESALIDGDILYAVVNQIPSALDLKTGQVIWEARTNGLHPNPTFTHGSGSFLKLGDYLLLPYNDDLLAFESQTGRQLGRVDGFRFGYPELRETYSRASLLNQADGKLYIGSASRSFAVLDEAKLIEKLHQVASSGRSAAALTPAIRASEEAAWYPAQSY